MVQACASREHVRGLMAGCVCTQPPLLAGAPIYMSDGSRLKGKDSTAKGEAKGLEHLHLVTFDLGSHAYTDHGAIFFANGTGNYPIYVNSITVTGDYVYALGRVEESTEGHDGRSDLFRVRIPGK